MPLVNWNEQLSVGVGAMDAQHQALIDLLNKLHEAMRAGQGKAVLEPIVNDLATYAQRHFSSEERLMASHACPGQAAHQAEHAAFIAKVKKFQDGLAAGSTALTIEVMTFLRDWLVKHIQGTDKCYGRHICGQR